jgi:hypothetical protein
MATTRKRHWRSFRSMFIAGVATGSQDRPWNKPELKSTLYRTCRIVHGRWLRIRLDHTYVGFHRDFRFHGIGDQTVFPRGLKRSPRPCLDYSCVFVSACDPDDGCEVQTCKDLRSVEFNTLCSLCTALKLRGASDQGHPALISIVFAPAAGQPRSDSSQGRSMSVSRSSSRMNSAATQPTGNFR